MNVPFLIDKTENNCHSDICGRKCLLNGTSWKSFQFNFDDNYIREADGTLILNLQVPVTNAEVPDEKK